MHSHIPFRPRSAFPNTAYPASSWQSPALTHTSLTPRRHGSRITTGRCLCTHDREADNPMSTRDLASGICSSSHIPHHILRLISLPPLPSCTVPSIPSPLHAEPPSPALPEAPQPPSLPIPVPSSCKQQPTMSLCCSFGDAKRRREGIDLRRWGLSQSDSCREDRMSGERRTNDARWHRDDGADDYTRDECHKAAISSSVMHNQRLRQASATRVHM